MFLVGSACAIQEREGLDQSLHQEKLWGVLTPAVPTPSLSPKPNSGSKQVSGSPASTVELSLNQNIHAPEPVRPVEPGVIHSSSLTSLIPNGSSAPCSSPTATAPPPAATASAPTSSSTPAPTSSSTPADVV